MWRAVLPAITAIAYLFIAATPCPPVAEPRGAASHGPALASDDPASLTAPCVCDCEHGATSFGSAKRGEPAVLTAPTPPLREPAHRFAREREGRLPDAPISVASPVPIAA